MNKKNNKNFFALRKISRQFFELPKMDDNTKIYLEPLEKQKKLVTNIVQRDFWKRKKIFFGNKHFFPLLLYQDDFETNNPLGTYEGKG